MIQIFEKEAASNVDALDVLNKQQRIMLYIITMFGIVGASGGILGFYGFQTLVFKFLLIGYDIVFIATFLGRVVFIGNGKRSIAVLNDDVGKGVVVGKCEQLWQSNYFMLRLKHHARI